MILSDHFETTPFNGNELSFLPGLDLVGSDTGDRFFGVGGFGAAEAIQEELAILGLVQGLFIALGIAEHAENFLLDQLGSFGIVFDLADDLFHGTSPFPALCAAIRWYVNCFTHAYHSTTGKRKQWTAMFESLPLKANPGLFSYGRQKIPEKNIVTAIPKYGVAPSLKSDDRILFIPMP